MDKCSPSPCGLNGECRANGEYPECVCRKNFEGKPLSCPADCQGDCPAQIACLNDDCKNLAESTCGLNAKSFVQEYKYACVCPENYHGDPYNECKRVYESKIKTANQTYEVIRNNSIILSCESSHSGQSVMRNTGWMKRPENASYQYYLHLPEPRMRPYRQYNLRIENVRHSDAGFYVCQLKDYKMHNITYKLEILDASNHHKLFPTSNFTIPYTTVKVMLNDTVVLPCEGVNDLDAEKMTWVEIYYKTQAFNSDYIELKLNSDDHRIKILQGTNLEIQNAQPEDAGTYSCFLSGRRYDEFERLLLDSPKFKILDSERPDGHRHNDPCQGNPCGLDSECYPHNGKPICSCRNFYKGIPPFCSPIHPNSRCTRGKDCYELACINKQCKHLCEESCILQKHAKCRIQHYRWTCMCDDGFVGNPYAGGCLPAKTVVIPSNQTKEIKEVKLLNHTTQSLHLKPFDETTQSENLGHHLNNYDQETCGAGCLLLSIGGPVVLLLLLIASVHMIMKKRIHHQVIHYRSGAKLLNDDIDL